MNNNSTQTIVDPKAKTKSKIRALLSKTTENGATKEEMESALNKANQLMLENFIEEHEIGSGELKRKCVSKTIPFFVSSYDLCIGKLCNSLTKLFDCNYYWVKSKKELTFFGYEEDVEMCIYFYELICRSTLKAKDMYKYDIDYLHEKQKGKHGKTMMASFIKGFIWGVCRKMNNMYADRVKNIHQKYGLVVLKSEDVKTQFDSLFTVKSEKAKKYFIEQMAYSQGLETGENFDLVQGINGDEFVTEKLN